MRVTFAAVLITLLFSTSVQAKWQEASSDHFLIYADTSESKLSEFAANLERFHHAMALAMALQLDTPSPSNRVTIYVVGNAARVRKLADDRFAAGFYVPLAGRSLAVIPDVASNSRDTPFATVVLLHEYAHHLLLGAVGLPLPRWMSEGAAEFYASARFDRDGSVWTGLPAQHRANELFYSREVPVTALFDEEQYRNWKSRGYDSFYGRSWLLYHYLFFAEERRGQFSNYANAMNEGLSSIDAAGRAFGDFEQLEDDLDDYLKQRLAALRVPPEALGEPTVRIRMLRDGEAKMMSVMVRSKVGVTREMALDLLPDARKVAERYGDDPAVLAALAEAEFDAGYDSEAIAAADKAIALDPSQTNAYVQKGFALFRMARSAEDQESAFAMAREPFIQLNAIEHDHPLPLIYFYRSFAEAGVDPPDLAFDGLVRAAELAPFDISLRMNLGMALLMHGEPARARPHLLAIARHPHAGRASDAAQALLDKIDAGQTEFSTSDFGEEEPDERSEDEETEDGVID